MGCSAVKAKRTVERPAPGTGDTARAASAWSVVGGEHEQARQADTGQGQARAVWASRAETNASRPARGLGWFVNRSSKITLEDQAVQALRASCWVSGMYQARAGARVIEEPESQVRAVSERLGLDATSRCLRSEVGDYLFR